MWSSPGFFTLIQLSPTTQGPKGQPIFCMMRDAYCTLVQGYVKLKEKKKNKQIGQTVIFFLSSKHKWVQIREMTTTSWRK